MLEDDALERLYARLDMAIFQINNDDPDVEWRNTHRGHA